MPPTIMAAVAVAAVPAVAPFCWAMVGSQLWAA
jgi:hypothetical protein